MKQQGCHTVTMYGPVEAPEIANSERQGDNRLLIPRATGICLLTHHFQFTGKIKYRFSSYSRLSQEFIFMTFYSYLIQTSFPLHLCVGGIIQMFVANGSDKAHSYNSIYKLSLWKTLTLQTRVCYSGAIFSNN
jgi:hypothetical protein